MWFKFYALFWDDELSFIRTTHFLLDFFGTFISLCFWFTSGSEFVCNWLSYCPLGLLLNKVSGFLQYTGVQTKQSRREGVLSAWLFLIQFRSSFLYRYESSHCEKRYFGNVTPHLQNFLSCFRVLVIRAVRTTVSLLPFDVWKSFLFVAWNTIDFYIHITEVEGCKSLC
jgi:hypothetical protein